MLERALAFPACGVLMLAMLLTQSRGALVALADRRHRVVCLRAAQAAQPVGPRPSASPGAAPVTAWGLSKAAFTVGGTPLAQREAVAGEFGLFVLLMIVLLLVVGLGVSYGMSRVVPTMRVRRRVGLVVVAALLALPLALFTSVAASDRGLTGTVSDRVDELTSETAAAPPEGAGRLTVSSSSRARYWREAGDVFGERPGKGTGRGHLLRVATALPQGRARGPARARLHPADHVGPRRGRRGAQRPGPAGLDRLRAASGRARAPAAPPPGAAAADRVDRRAHGAARPRRGRGGVRRAVGDRLDLVHSRRHRGGSRRRRLRGRARRVHGARPPAPPPRSLPSPRARAASAARRGAASAAAVGVLATAALLAGAIWQPERSSRAAAKALSEIEEGDLRDRRRGGPHRPRRQPAGPQAALRPGLGGRGRRARRRGAPDPRAHRPGVPRRPPDLAAPGRVRAAPRRAAASARGGPRRPVPGSVLQGRAPRPRPGQGRGAGRGRHRRQPARSAPAPADPSAQRPAARARRRRRRSGRRRKRGHRGRRRVERRGHGRWRRHPRRRRPGHAPRASRRSPASTRTRSRNTGEPGTEAAPARAAVRLRRGRRPGRSGVERLGLGVPGVDLPGRQPAGHRHRPAGRVHHVHAALPGRGPHPRLAVLALRGARRDQRQPPLVQRPQRLRPCGLRRRRRGTATTASSPPPAVTGSACCSRSRAPPPGGPPATSPSRVAW